MFYNPIMFCFPLRDAEPGINVWGLVAVILFYVLILVIGLIASWKNKSLKSQQSEQVMLAGRNIGWFVGVFTMTGNILQRRHMGVIVVQITDQEVGSLRPADSKLEKRGQNLDAHLRGGWITEGARASTAMNDIDLVWLE